MLVVETIAKIRRTYFIQGKSIKLICRELRVSRNTVRKVARPRYSGFKAYEPGYLHIDVKYLPQMADQTSRRYLFVAVDRATRRVFIRIHSSKAAANARRFPRDMGSGLAPFASEPYSRTMGRSSPTVSLACASANKAENMSSTGSAPNWTSNTA